MQLCRGRRTVPNLRPLTLAYYAMRRRQKTARYWDWAGAGSRGAGLSVEG